MASASVDPRDRRQALQTEAGRNCAETVATPSLDTTDPALAAMTREAHRLTLSRLVDEVLDAVEDGDSGVPESGRLHTWVRVEFLPWAQAENMSISDEAERAAVRSDIGVIVGLNSLLAGANHQDAAAWTRQLQRTALIMLARLDYLAQS